MKIIQIGAHKGNDDMTNIIKNYENIELIILVEPQSQYNDSLIVIRIII